MKKKTKIIVSIAAVLIIAGGIGFAATRSAEVGYYERLGSYYRQANSSMSTDVAAEYHGQKLMMEVLDYQRKMTGDETTSDYELARKLMGNYVLYEYAVNHGLEAEQERIDALIQSQRDIYATEDGKKDFDDYCRGMGVTFDEYIENILAPQVPRIIARNKLREYFAEEFCNANGYEYDKKSLPFGAQEYVDAKLEQIIADAQSEIIYYVPVTG